MFMFSEMFVLIAEADNFLGFVFVVAIIITAYIAHAVGKQEGQEQEQIARRNRETEYYEADIRDARAEPFHSGKRQGTNFGMMRSELANQSQKERFSEGFAAALDGINDPLVVVLTKAQKNKEKKERRLLKKEPVIDYGDINYQQFDATQIGSKFAEEYLAIKKQLVGRKSWEDFAGTFRTDVYHDDLNSGSMVTYYAFRTAMDPLLDTPEAVDPYLTYPPDHADEIEDDEIEDELETEEPDEDEGYEEEPDDDEIEDELETEEPDEDEGYEEEPDDDEIEDELETEEPDDDEGYEEEPEDDEIEDELETEEPDDDAYFYMNTEAEEAEDDEE